MPTALLISFVLLSAPAAETQPPSEQPTQPAVQANTGDQVKMRKLHLVRPELLPYPLAYEIYC